MEVDSRKMCCAKCGKKTFTYLLTYLLTYFPTYLAPLNVLLSFLFVFKREKSFLVANVTYRTELISLRLENFCRNP